MRQTLSLKIFPYMRACLSLSCQLNLLTPLDRLTDSSHSQFTQFRWRMPDGVDDHSWAVDNVLVGNDCPTACSGHGDCHNHACKWVSEPVKFTTSTCTCWLVRMCFRGSTEWKHQRMAESVDLNDRFVVMREFRAFAASKTVCTNWRRFFLN